ncbi:MAG TPA: sugar transferase [Acidobacteriaceae bacterium]|jgi:lipopolysaccharide/colanic/teichoic acid biosynthesis glycosyltransferase
MSANSLAEVESASDSDLFISLGRNFYSSAAWGRAQHPVALSEVSRDEDEQVSADEFASFESVQWEMISRAVHSWRTNSFEYRVIKRALDITVLLAFLPLVLPLFAVIAVLIRIGSPGSIFYQQTRIGRFGRQFRIWKFRSMHVDCEAILAEHLRNNPAAAQEWKECHKLRNDPRITKVGKFLRRSSLDELPQLINVLRGEMSLVGPRPIVAAEIPKFREAYLFYTSARPGMSGLWQVSGRSDLSYGQRIELDSNYVRKWELLLDLRILWQTAGAVWRSEGAV